MKYRLEKVGKSTLFAFGENNSNIKCFQINSDSFNIQNVTISVKVSADLDSKKFIRVVFIGDYDEWNRVIVELPYSETVLGNFRKAKYHTIIKYLSNEVGYNFTLALMSLAFISGNNKGKSEVKNKVLNLMAYLQE